MTNGGLWDHTSTSVAALLTPGPNTLTVTGNPEGTLDCLSLVGAVFDLPGGSVTPPVIIPPVIVGSPAATGPAANVPTLSTFGLGGVSLAAALWGIYGLRNRRRDGDMIDEGGTGNDVTK